MVKAISYLCQKHPRERIFLVQVLAMHITSGLKLTFPNVSETWYVHNPHKIGFILITS